MMLIVFNIFFSRLAFCATATASMNVTATVGNLCIVTAVDTSFGTIGGYFLTVTNVSNGSISVACTTGVPYTIAIGAGNNGNASYRRMVFAATNFIGYYLYSDSGYTTLWGNGTTYGATVAGTGTGLLQTRTVYAQIPIGQAPVPAGAYVDTAVAVTVSY
jgi:spore coat protein U-like protein